MLSDDNLIWLDLEMTGLNPDDDVIIEIATVVTDKDLNVLAEGPVLAIYQSEDILGKMDAWNQNQHGKSGLIERVRQSDVNVSDAERQTLDFLRQYVPKGVSPLCGNSICQDRRFMWRLMPELERYFHYRHIDVSTLKELAKRWAPDVYDKHQKPDVHLALADIHASIDELKYYRQSLLSIA